MCRLRPFTRPVASIRVAAACLLLALAGCIEWEEQEVRVAFDAARDRLDVQLVYRGLLSGDGHFGRPLEGGPDEDGHAAEEAESTREQLYELAAGRPIFALLDPIVRFDLDAIPVAEDPRLAFLRANLSLDHGDFFRDERGRLCGWQQLHVERLSEVVRAAGTLLRDEIAAQARRAADGGAGGAGGAGGGLLEWLGLDDAESVALQAAVLKVPFAWTALRDGTVALRLPASERAVRRLAGLLAEAPTWNEWAQRRRQSLDVPRAAAVPGEARRTAAPGSAGEDDDTAALLALLKSLGVEVVPMRLGCELRLALHDQPGRPWRLESSWVRSRSYDLVPHLVEAGFQVRGVLDDAALAREFADFRSR